MPNFGLKITSKNVDYLYNVNDYYSTNALKTNKLYKDKFQIYRQVLFFNTSNNIDILFNQQNGYILSAKYEFFDSSDIIPILHDVAKSININNTEQFLYYYTNPIIKTTVIKINNSFYNNKIGLIIIEFLKEYSPPLSILPDEDTTFYIIDFENLADIYDLQTQLDSLPITEGTDLNSDKIDIITNPNDENLTWYNFQNDDPILTFTSKKLKSISLELYYNNIINPSNILITLSNNDTDNLTEHKILDSTNSIYPDITFIYSDIYNAPTSITRIANEINIININFLGWSSLTEECSFLNIKSLKNDIKNCYFKKIILEYSNIDIPTQYIDVIIDFTQYDTPNDLRAYIRTLPIYVNDRLDQVQYYGLIEKYKRWKFGLAQSSINYLLSFSAKNLKKVTQEFYFASNETDFFMLTSFDSKPLNDAGIMSIDNNFIRTYDPNNIINQEIDISNNRANQLFTIKYNLLNWIDNYSFNNITFANYNGYIYNEYMHDGFWSKIILTYV